MLLRHPRRVPGLVLATTTVAGRDLLSSATKALNRFLLARARALVLKAIRVRPESAEPWYLLGILHEVEKQPKAAKEAYQAALLIDPGYKLALAHLRNLHSEPRPLVLAPVSGTSGDEAWPRCGSDRSTPAPRDATQRPT